MAPAAFFSALAVLGSESTGVGGAFLFAAVSGLLTALLLYFPWRAHSPTTGE